MKILLVDDEPSALKQIKIYLEKNNQMNIDTITSPKDALEMIDEKGYDAIISDYKMPQMNGLEFLEKIREKGIDKPFIIFTGKGNEEVAKEALNKGANRYVQKDIDLETKSKILSEAIKKEVNHYEAEKQLEAGREMIVFMAENSGNLMFRIDENMRVQYANSMTVDYLGVREREIMGRKITKFLTEEEAEGLEKSVEKVFETGEGKEYETQAESMGNKWFNVLISPIPDPETGEVQYVLITAQDITERKRAEQRQEFLHSLLRHDVRNKIQVIQGYTDLLEIADDEETQDEYICEIVDGVDECLNLIDKVRNMRKAEEAHDLRAMRLKSAVESVIDEFKVEDIEIEQDNLDHKVLGDPLLKEIFANLIENAINHADCETIKISPEEIDGKVKIIVEDDGVGISSDLKERIFEKGEKGGDSSGTGLGMNLVKKITETYGGSIEVKDSELGGARFDIILNTPEEENG